MSDKMTTKQSSDDVLKNLGFIKLSEGITLYIPSTTPATTNPSTTSTADPTFLIFCSWAFAQPRHIAKYLTQYQKLYPTTTILLIQNAIGNMIWTPDTWQYSYFESAAAAIQAHISSTNNPHVLLHACSNGGTHAAVQLSETCRVSFGGMRLPVDAFILDSAPGIPKYQSTVNAMIHGVPNGNPVMKGTVAALSWLMVGTTGLFHVLGIMEPAGRKLYRKLYDPYDVFVFKGTPRADKERTPVPRTYIFSTADSMIDKDDVVAHAELAAEEMRRAGVSEAEVQDLVRQENFGQTAHVNHVKGDADRYWRVVRETWERSQQQ